MLLISFCACGSYRDENLSVGDSRRLRKPWLHLLFIVVSLYVCWRQFADRWGIRSEKLVVQAWRTRMSRIEAGSKAMQLRIIYEFRPSISIARTYISWIVGCALCTRLCFTHSNWQCLLRCCPHCFVCCPLWIDQAMIHEVVTLRPFHLWSCSVLAEILNVVGSMEFRHIDIISSIGQGHVWILVDRFVRLAEVYFVW